MNRIFYVLATFALLFLLTTLGLGLGLRAGNIRDSQDREAQQRATVHRLAGISAGVVVLLVNSIVVTYFIGTSRWCKEVVETYGMDAVFIRRSAHLKRRTFPVSVMSMLVVVGIAALGAAADPAASMQPAPLAGISWANLHFLGACLGIGAIFYGFVIQGGNIRANHAIIGDVMAEVKRVRLERGLAN